MNMPALRTGSPAQTLRQLLLFLVTATVVVVDQALKAIVRTELGGGRVIAVLHGLVQLDYTQNTGAAFGVFRAGGILFTAIAAIVSAAIIINYKRIAVSSPLVRLGLGLILGGAIGNLIDRLRFGYVVDFIDLRWWPVFNLADAAIVIGVAALVVEALFRPRRSGAL